MAYKCKLCSSELNGEYYSLINLETKSRLPVRYCIDCFGQRLNKKGSRISKTCECGKEIDTSVPKTYYFLAKNLVCEDCIEKYIPKEEDKAIEPTDIITEKVSNVPRTGRVAGMVKCAFCGDLVSNDIRVEWNKRWYHPGCKSLEIEKRENRTVICHLCGNPVLVKERVCEGAYSYHPQCFEEYQRKKDTKSVKCHMCGEQVLITERVADTQGYWYHPNCLEQQEKRTELLNYICMLFGLKKPGPIVFSQLKRFTQGYGYTYDGILKALKYHYEIKHGDKEKANEAIGIVGFVYDEAQRYYTFIKQKQAQIISDIEPTLNPPQIKIEIQTDKPTRAKDKYSFDNLLSDDLF